MLEKLIDSMLFGDQLSKTEIEFCANEMRRLHELDIAKFGKGKIPRESSRMMEIWSASQRNIKNIKPLHGLVGKFLLDSSMFDLEPIIQFGPVKDPALALRRKEVDFREAEDLRLRNHNHD